MLLSAEHRYSTHLQDQFKQGSWKTFIGHLKDSLLRIIDFGVHAGDVDGAFLCRVFNKTIFIAP
jgi:hypothetical protein